MSPFEYFGVNSEADTSDKRNCFVCDFVVVVTCKVVISRHKHMTNSLLIVFVYVFLALLENLDQTKTIFKRPRPSIFRFSRNYNQLLQWPIFRHAQLRSNQSRTS